MANPFEKRATEYLRDDEAFLAVVTPEPLSTFFQKPAEEGRLYDRLAVIIGTPGSGKTTLARLFQYPTLRTLLRNKNLNTYKPLIDTLTACLAVVDDLPTVAEAGNNKTPATAQAIAPPTAFIPTWASRPWKTGSVEH